MRPSIPPARRLVLPAAVAVLLASSLAPARFHVAGPTLRTLSAQALMPVTEPIRTASSWLHDETELPAFKGTPQDLLSDEIRQQGGEITRLREENDQLRRTLAELQGLRRALGDDFSYRQARVLGSSTDAAADTVQIDLGTNDGVRPGSAVVDARKLALVGRVIQAGPTTSAVRPVASRSARIEVLLTRPRLAGEGVDEARRRTVLLEFEPPDTFVCRDAPDSIAVGVGDYARLSDHGGTEPWPRIVQGMIIGVVRSVRADPDQPLRQIIEVDPIRSLRRSDSVFVVVPTDHGAELDDGEAKG